MSLSKMTIERAKKCIAAKIREDKEFRMGIRSNISMKIYNGIQNISDYKRILEWAEKITDDIIDLIF